MGSLAYSDFGVILWVELGSFCGCLWFGLHPHRAGRERPLWCDRAQAILLTAFGGGWRPEGLQRRIQDLLCPSEAGDDERGRVLILAR